MSMGFRLLVLSSVILLASLAPASAKARKETVIPPITLNHDAMDKLGWKLSVQAYTFGRTGVTLFETIDILHGLGVRYIELYPGHRLSPQKPHVVADHNMSAQTMAELQAKLKDANITAVNYGVVALGNNEAEARKVFAFARQMGIQTIVSEPKDGFEMLDKLCAEYSINVAFHNHPRPSYYWNPDTVLKHCKGRSSRMGACADTGHWYRSGLDPIDCLKKLKGHIISLHFKDLSPDKKDRPWGTGVLNAKAMLEEIKCQGIKPVFSIEYESTSGEELVANVARCCTFFSDMAIELASK